MCGGRQGCCLIPQRSKPKYKTSCEHPEKRVSKPRRTCSPDWDYGSESDCTCSDYYPCDGSCRGWPTNRVPIYHDGDGIVLHQNINQQNINVMCGSKGGQHHGHRSQDRDRRNIVLPETPESYGPGHRSGPLPRHHDGRCCIHGLGARQCNICSPVRAFPAAGRQKYISIQGENGRIDFYDRDKLMEQAKNFCEEVQKKRNDEQEAKNKRINDTADLLGNLLKPQAPLSTFMWPGDSGRSAVEVRAELARVKADKRQLHTGGLFLTREDKAHCQDGRSKQDAMCSGALQCEGEDQEKKNKNKSGKHHSRPDLRVRQTGFVGMNDRRSQCRVVEAGSECDDGGDCGCCFV